MGFGPLHTPSRGVRAFSQGSGIEHFGSVLGRGPTVLAPEEGVS